MIKYRQEVLKERESFLLGVICQVLKKFRCVLVSSEFLMCKSFNECVVDWRRYKDLFGSFKRYGRKRRGGKEKGEVGCLLVSIFKHSMSPIGGSQMVFLTDAWPVWLQPGRPVSPVDREEADCARTSRHKM